MFREERRRKKEKKKRKKHLQTSFHDVKNKACLIFHSDNPNEQGITPVCKVSQQQLKSITSYELKAYYSLLACCMCTSDGLINAS